jgi:hypothetical protein
VDLRFGGPVSPALLVTCPGKSASLDRFLKPTVQRLATKANGCETLHIHYVFTETPFNLSSQKSSNVGATTVLRQAASRDGKHRHAHVDRPERQVRYCWEIIADNLSKAGWSWGCVATVDREGRTIWIADAHRDDGKRFVVHADEKLTAFLELESTIRPPGGISLRRSYQGGVEVRNGDGVARGAALGDAGRRETD